MPSTTAAVGGLGTQKSSSARPKVGATSTKATEGKRVPVRWSLLVAVAAALAARRALISPKLALDDAEIDPAAAKHVRPSCIPADVPKQVHAQCADKAKIFPLVVSPAGSSPMALDAWIAENHAIVSGWLLEYGALVFRGFATAEASDFELAVRAFSSRLDNVYKGTSPRRPVNGSSYVFTASEFEPWKPVPVHCEMSFLPSPPEHIFFFGVEIRGDMSGGETPLVDMQAVAREMAPEVRDTFATKGIRYSRVYPAASSRHPLDKYDFFRTKPYEELMAHVATGDNSSRIEAEARRQGFEPSWVETSLGDALGGAALRLTNEADAFRPHPTTGATIWHNHFAVLHSRAWADELAYVAARLSSARYALLSDLFYLYDGAIRLLLGADALGQHATHRGGEPIAPEHAWHIRRLLWRNMFIAPWKQGDVVFIDNFRIGHARMPYDRDPRKVWTIWSHPPEKAGADAE